MTTPAAIPEQQRVEADSLPRGFGVATAAFIVVSSMIGTGVLTTSGFTVFYTQSNQLMLWLWAIGGIVAICGALSIAELAAALPRSGGDYVFLYEAYGPLVAFLSGWVSFLIGFGAPIAAISFAAATYLTAPFEDQLGSPGLVRLLIASVAIILMAFVHNVGSVRSIQVQGGTTIIKLMVLLLLAAFGITAGWGNFENLNDRPPITFNVVQSMAFSLVFIAYSYTGWNGAAYLAGEIENPGKQLPRAIILGTLVVIVIYLALNLMFVLANPAAQLIARVPIVEGEPQVSVLAPIAEISANNLFGKSASNIVSVAIGLTMMASLSAYVLTGPRVAFAMARAGHFPEYVGRLSKQGTPTRALVLQCGWALVLLWSNSFESIVTYAGVGLSMFTMLSVAAVYVLRWKQPNLDRPFRTPGYPVVPAVFLAVTALLTYAAFSQKPLISGLALTSILAGIPVYYLIRRKMGS